MRRVQLSVYVDSELADALGERALLAGMSRSAFMERLLVQEAEGGDKRLRRNIAFLMCAGEELLRDAGEKVRKQARDRYNDLVARQNLGEDEPVEDQRRAARR